MRQNKTAMYIKYAFGEIALVMIGILLALQVNDWNESRKASIQEVKILKELNNDLKSNFIEVTETFDYTKNRLRSSKRIIEYLKNNKALDDSLKIAFENIQIDGLFNNSNTAYEYIKNKGFDVLSNDSLRIEISKMYERHISNILIREGEDRTMINDEVRPLLLKTFKNSPPVDNFFEYDLILNTPIDIVRTRNDVVFQNIIIRLQNYLVLRLRWQEETLIELKDLITNIESEIERLS